ncbi:hypothetical protein SAMN04487968_110141 [Nocardioides terrae]|uniref:Swt1-like HEPN domain-containing protein n=2 Tax=Nocardioides terrae TaxID=574651 RepID=A0A1I1LVU7_9ACTN|nr:hypothetical protein SAMN04487968_110141 [Nocardioides terrae]
MTWSYRQRWGDDWLANIVPRGKLEAWERRRDAEREKRAVRGVAAVPENLLDYSNLYDLILILKTHWEPLAPALGSQRSFIPLLGRLETLRDAIAHGRPLLPFEHALAAGIAGDIRNRVTIFMSTQDQDGQYFARIETARDSFGNQVNGPMQDTGSIGGCRTGLTVRPSERVQFDVVGWDAQGRELHWGLHVRHRRVDAGTGNETTLTWNVATADIGAACTVMIAMWPEPSEYRRYNEGGSDGRAFFYYKVSPPLPG